MKRALLVVILFFLLVVEGIAIDLLPLSLLETDILIVPHWILMFLILVTVKFDKSNTFYAVVFGILFGILVDVVYGDVLGVYMFVYAVTLYVVHILKRLLLTNFIVTFVITIFAIVLVESQIYVIYAFVGAIDISTAFFMTHRLLPTVIANLLFFLLIFGIFSNRLVKWSDEELQHVS